MDITVPDEVLKIHSKLKKAGFEVYFVGGEVRDILTNKPVTDWDFATEATPEQVQNVFPNSFYDNNFGTVGVPTTNGKPVEITTFRTEGGYSNARHPDTVSWGKTIEEDLSRRDFTMNAIASKNPPPNLELIDPYAGQEDIKNRVIRTVGNPDDRFSEDALRLLRAIRFATQLDFTIENETWKAIQMNAEQITKISGERIRDELLKILANDAVKYAKDKGIDVVITDHHVPGKQLPDAFSIVHTTKLCGAGVAYLLAKEISNQEPRTKNQEPKNHLELVALATVADLVPLTGVNRAMVKFGVEALRKTNRPGLLALFTEAAIKKEEVDVYKIGHVIAPRLNASGRIAHAMDSLRLLCTKDPTRARKLANTLGETNKSRQALTIEATEHADLISDQIDLTQKFIFVYNAEYNPGVIGLVASRLVERHYRPSIAVSVGDTVSKGSARSVAGFNIVEYIRTFQEFLIDAGGHPMAAGFTVETSRLEEFRTALLTGSNVISDELLARTLKIDCELTFDKISLDLYSEIQKLAPFGMNNSEPVFVSKSVTIKDLKSVGKNNSHMKMTLSQNGKELGGILFKAEGLEVKKGDKVDVVYMIEKNEWNGNQKIQVKIIDVKLVKF